MTHCAALLTNANSAAPASSFLTWHGRPTAEARRRLSTTPKAPTLTSPDDEALKSDHLATSAQQSYSSRPRGQTKGQTRRKEKAPSNLEHQAHSDLSTTSCCCHQRHAAMSTPRREISRYAAGAAAGHGSRAYKILRGSLAQTFHHDVGTVKESRQASMCS